MTLRQEAYEKMATLPDNSIRLVLALVDELLRQENANEIEMIPVETRKRALREMMAMKEKSKYPDDFDYQNVLQEALSEKYGRID